jgi:hypothetical protein
MDRTKLCHLNNLYKKYNKSLAVYSQHYKTLEHSVQ